MLYLSEVSFVKSLTGHPAAGFPRMFLFETEFYDLCHSSDVTRQNPYPQGLTQRTRLCTGNSLLLNLQDLLQNTLFKGHNVSNIITLIFGTFSLCKKWFSGVILPALYWAILYLYTVRISWLIYKGPSLLRILNLFCCIMICWRKLVLC